MNLSQEFHQLLNRSEPALDEDTIRELRQNYQVILLKGFLGDLLPKRFDSYFFDQMRWMRENEIGYWRLDRSSGYGTQNLSERNVEAIANAVSVLHEQRPAKRILIVSHSKGGIDALEALLRRSALMDGKLAGWIALQAPFHGTPVADWATHNPLFNPVAESLLGGIMKGDRKVAASMTVDARTAYMDRNAEAIEKLAGRLDILNFASRSVAGDPSLFRPLRFAIDKIAKVPNDGLLPTQSEILRVDGSPCSPFVESEHIDHIYPVFPLLPDKPDGAAASHRKRRIQIFCALLNLWMSHRRHV